jgi:uncharacterized protein (TIGR00369 family)
MTKPSAISIEDFNALIREELPFAWELGFRVEHLAAGEARVRLPVDRAHLRPGGTVSGPTMMGLADFTMYAAVLSRIGRVKMAVTTNLNANFLRLPPQKDLIAEGRLQKLGRRLAYGEVTIFSQGEDEPVCHVTSTYSLPPGGNHDGVPARAERGRSGGDGAS